MPPARTRRGPRRLGGNMLGRFVGGSACARSAAGRRPSRTTTWSAIWLVGVSLACAGTAVAGPREPTSSRAARRDAISSLPLEQIAPAMRDKVESTVQRATIYRRLPTEVTACDPDMYLFLVRHPEVVVRIWEVMNISNVALARTGPDTFRASDNEGTLCSVKYCYSDPETQVIYAEGSYSGPLFRRPVQARCVLLLKSGYMQETDGRYYITSRMDCFVEIDHAGVELLARTLQMLVHRAADYNFVETAAFIGTVSRTAEVNPRGMERLAGKLTGIDPAVRGRFAELSREIGEQAEMRAAVPATVAIPVSKTTRKPRTSRR